MTKRLFAVTVKAVIMKGDKALCLKRSDEEVSKGRINSIDLWDLPGGGLQYFEPLDKGLLREVKEETKLDVEIIKPINTHDIIKPFIHIVLITYLSEYKGGDVVLSGEHKEYKWVDKNEISDIPLQKWLKRLLIDSFCEYDLYKTNSTM